MEIFAIENKFVHAVEEFRHESWTGYTMHIDLSARPGGCYMVKYGREQDQGVNLIKAFRYFGEKWKINT
jgi:hypothetical protein